MISLTNFLLASHSLAQEQSFFDSLNIAKEKIYSADYSEGISLLEKMEKGHPNDENIIRLKAQGLYWSKDLEGTIAYLEKAIQRLPESLEIKRDYARILFENGVYPKSRQLLIQYIEQYPKDPESNLLLARMSYWDGQPPSKALAYLNKILDPYPDNLEALALKEEIELTTSPTIALNTSYISDSQPLEAIISSLKINLYQSALLQPSLLAEVRSYTTDQQTLYFQVSNKTNIIKSGTEISLNAGLFRASWTETISPLGGINIRQKTFNDLYLTAAAERGFYLFTLASLETEVLPIGYSASFGRDMSENWTGQVSFRQDNFSNDNYVRTSSAWILFPILKQKAVRLDIGYAFMMADSKENRFEVVEPISGLISQTEIGTVFPGIFNPYFTPQNEYRHSALAKIDVKLSPKFNMSFNNNIGVYAIIDNPNFIFFGVDQDQNNGSVSIPGSPQGNPNNPIQNPTIGENQIMADDLFKVFVPTRYYPLDLRSRINWNISRKTSFALEYIYLRTIFFDGHNANATLKFTL
ncbi:tetratricopeptide repeat protein [Aquiflexum lacus]|uniref:tetratricopeptide repeat protein n=1 Tax=Aquiflexum lacus TaxID=2483805 RepID=UPI001E58E277|nr:tetratricopeptide repeat protein [Aquiflexum lacus]